MALGFLTAILACGVFVTLFFWSLWVSSGCAVKIRKYLRKRYRCSLNIHETSPIRYDGVKTCIDCGEEIV
jgi:hypothetical protein